MKTVVGKMCVAWMSEKLAYMREGCPKSIVALSIIKSVSRGNIFDFLWLILNVPLAIVAARNIAFYRACAEGCHKRHDLLPLVLNKDQYRIYRGREEFRSEYSQGVKNVYRVISVDKSTVSR